MSGQCYGCGTEFGVFKKEHGCKNCGFAFCNKCLNEKSVPVPKKNNAKHHVCHKCFKILTGPVSQSSEECRYDLPEAYLKRVAALQEREKGGHSSNSSHPPRGSHVIPEHLRQLDKADREIAMRLEKLKADDRPKETVTDSHLHARLAQLKGQQYVPEQKPTFVPTDRRPETQQVDDLIEQLIAEVNIDSLRPDPAQEVESRLARFRQVDGTKSTIDSNNLNQNDKGIQEGNDLNKVDKMGCMGRGYGQDGRNIETEKSAGASVSAAAAAADDDDDEISIEEMQKLMSQAAREIHLDAQRVMKGLQQDKLLMDKLRELQKQKADNSVDSDTVDSDADNTVQTEGAVAATDNLSDDDDDEIATKKILQRYLDEAKIDSSVGKMASPEDKPTQLSTGRQEHNGKKRHKGGTSSGSVELKASNLQPPAHREDLVDSDYDDPDELPYCCICTEDASIRCRDCDQDLYCHRCFKGCHEDMEVTDHRTVPYVPPKGYR